MDRRPLVLLGRGRVQFSPRLKAERVQIRIFCGQDSLNAEFDAVFLRLNPGEFNAEDRTGLARQAAAGPG